jgi:NAD(P)-dependent dehydrogenase (short-subunit alcohol dehydrogenase family)
MPAHPFDLTGKVTLVTGANSGIGFAEAIARAGGDVVIWGRREDRNAEAAERLRAHGVRVASDVVDVADEAAPSPTRSAASPCICSATPRATTPAT